MLVPDGKHVSRLYWKGLRGDQWGLRDFPRTWFDSFLDIGANVGFVSLTMRVLFPQARICAIEPCSTTYDVLVQNMQHLYVETARLALGDGRPAYGMSGRLGAGGRSVANRFRNCDTTMNDTESCPSLTLAGLFEHFKLDPRHAFVKIDAEGAEQCLMGDLASEKVLAQCKMIGFEFHTRGTSIAMEKYNEWVRACFRDTHDIEITPSKRPTKWSDARLLRK